MKIVTFGNNLENNKQLQQKAERVTNIDEETAELAAKMLESLKKEKGVGLAAPQIGINKRIFVTHIESDMPRVFINPSILETSQETYKSEEGCLSVPGVWGEVDRFKEIKIQAWNEKGKPFTLETNEPLSRVIQHEYDHLEGVLFFERMPEDQKEKLLEKYEKKCLKKIKANK